MRTARLPVEDFIKRSRAIHGDKYDYSNLGYINTRHHVTITCPEHGVFSQRANSHLRGMDCQKCAGTKRRTGTQKFIEKSIAKHGDRYSYDHAQYTNAHGMIKIECQAHGAFEQPANDHLKGHGCPSCGYDAVKGPRITNEDWVSRFKEVHGDRYIYDRVDYKSACMNILIGCRAHGYFKQKPYNHLHVAGEACHKCYASRGEVVVFTALDSMDVEYEFQAGFSSCKHKWQLSFDFFLPHHALLIEFDGEQHRRACWSFGGDDQFAEIQKRDAAKNRWARTHGIPLVRLRDIHLPRIDTTLEKLLSRRVGAQCHNSSWMT